MTKGTYASVVVVIFAIIFLVNPSISFGLAFFATRDKDLVMILSPFLTISTTHQSFAAQDPARSFRQIELEDLGGHTEVLDPSRPTKPPGPLS